MARLFLDTSALVKLYRAEPDSPAVRACIAPGDELVISPITPLEFRSAFFGLSRQQIIELVQAEKIIDTFLNDLSQYTVIPITHEVVNLAESLLQNWGIW